MNVLLNSTTILFLLAVMVGCRRAMPETGVSSSPDDYRVDSAAVVKASCVLAQSYFDRESYDQALDILERAYGVVVRNNLTSLEGDVLYALGRSWTAVGDYAQAFRYSFKSLEVNDLNDNQMNKALSLSNLAMLYCRIGYFQKALEYYEKSIRIHDDISYSNGGEFILIDIALCYFLMEDDERGAELLAMAAAAGSGRSASILEMKVNYATAVSAFRTGDMVTAEAACKKAIEKAVLLDNEVYHADNLVLLARIFETQNLNEEAETLLKRGLAIAEEYRLHDVSANIYRQLIKIHGNDPALLTFYQARLIGLKDRIYNVTLKNLLGKAQGDYEERQYNRTIMLQQEAMRIRSTSLQTERFIGLGNFIIIAAFAGLVVFLFVSSQQEGKFGILLANKVKERISQLKDGKETIAISHKFLRDAISGSSEKVLLELKHFQEGLIQRWRLTACKEDGMQETVERIRTSIVRLAAVSSKDQTEK